MKTVLDLRRPAADSSRPQQASPLKRRSNLQLRRDHYAVTQFKFAAALDRAGRYYLALQKQNPDLLEDVWQKIRTLRDDTLRSAASNDSLDGLATPKRERATAKSKKADAA